MRGAIPGLIWVPEVNAVGWIGRALNAIKELAETINAISVIVDLIDATRKKITEILEREAASTGDQERGEQIEDALGPLYALKAEEALRTELRGILQAMANDDGSVQLLSERLKKINAASEESEPLQALERYEVILQAFERKQIAQFTSPTTGNPPIFPSAAPDDSFTSATTPSDRPNVGNDHSIGTVTGTPPIIPPGIVEDSFTTAPEQSDLQHVVSRSSTDPLLCKFQVFAHLCEK